MPGTENDDRAATGQSGAIDPGADCMPWATDPNLPPWAIDPDDPDCMAWHSVGLPIVIYVAPPADPPPPGVEPPPPVVCPTAGPFHFTPDLVAIARQMLSEGESKAAIARAIGCSRGAVYHWARREGLLDPRPDRRPNGRTLDDAAAARVLHMLAGGMSQNAVGRALGVDHRTIGHLAHGRYYRHLARPVGAGV